MSDKLKETAQQLVIRFGADSPQYVQDQINTQLNGGNRRELDRSYLLLSEVEKLLKEET